MLLADWERAQAERERDEVLEDPLALAAALAAGQAIEGAVEHVERDHREPNPNGGTPLQRPLLTLLCPHECPFPVGSELWWTARPTLKAEVQSTAAGPEGVRVVLRVVAGMRGPLPEADARAVFSVYNTGWVPPAPLPADTPWTHTPGAAAEDDTLDMDAPVPRVEILAGLEAAP
jgi:hypothetical protein